MKIPKIVSVVFLAAATFTTPVMANTYEVNRTFSDDNTGLTFTLGGTVDITFGYYIISADTTALPFANVNLSLTVNGISYSLDQADYRIGGTGKFTINADPTTLTFGADYGDSYNGAYLAFVGSACYQIVAQGGFYEAADSPAGTALTFTTTLPTVFGSVPEVGSTFALLGLTLAAMGAARKKY